MATTNFQDFELGDADHEWNGGEAEKRVRKWAGAEDGPNDKYRDAHLWYDEEKPDNFGSYKMLIADVVDGQIKVLPRAVSAAAGVLDGARGGVNIPDGDATKAKQHLAKYYRKMGEEPPWQS